MLQQEWINRLFIFVLFIFAFILCYVELQIRLMPTLLNLHECIYAMHFGNYIQLYIYHSTLIYYQVKVDVLVCRIFYEMSHSNKFVKTDNNLSMLKMGVMFAKLWIQLYEAMNLCMFH